MLVAFEGIDGAGKTTYINEVKETLIKRNYRVVSFSFPTHDLNFNDKLFIGEGTELKAAQLMAYDKMKMSETISRYLDDNYIVLLDRYLMSGYAYQFITFNEFKEINCYMIKNFYPDITFYFDITVEQARKLIDQRLNNDSLDFSDRMYKIRKRYKEFIKNRTDAILHITDVYKPKYNILDNYCNRDIKNTTNIIVDNIISNLSDVTKYFIIGKEDSNEQPE